MCVQMTVLYLNQCFVYFHIDAVVIGYRLNQPCIGLLHLYVEVLLKPRLTFTLRKAVNMGLSAKVETIWDYHLL